MVSVHLMVLVFTRDVPLLMQEQPEANWMMISNFTLTDVGLYTHWM